MLETKFLEKLSQTNPNIVKYYGSSPVNDDWVLLFEYCPGGNLADLFMNFTENPYNAYTDTQIWWMMMEISNALVELHESNIAHRDLKMANILVGSDGRLKLTDFGSCDDRKYVISKMNYKEKQMVADTIKSNTTPYILSPEQCDVFSDYDVGVKVDQWALGILMYSLLYNEIPFSGDDRNKLLNYKYTRKKFRTKNNIPVNDNMHKILASLFNTDPKMRLGCKELHKICVAMLGADKNLVYRDLFQTGVVRQVKESISSKLNLGFMPNQTESNVDNENENKSNFDSLANMNLQSDTLISGISTTFNSIYSTIDSKVRNSTMYKNIVDSTGINEDPPNTLVLLSMADKCWQGKQHKFYLYLKKRGILTNDLVILKGLILVLNVVCNGVQENFEECENILLSVESSKTTYSQIMREDGSIEPMIEIIRNLNQLRKKNFKWLDTNYSVENSFVNNSYVDLDDHQLIINSNKLYSNAVKALNKLSMIEVMCTRRKLVQFFVKYCIIDYYNYLIHIYNYQNALTCTQIDEDAFKKLGTQMENLAFVYNEIYMKVTQFGTEDFKSDVRKYLIDMKYFKLSEYSFKTYYYNLHICEVMLINIKLVKYPVQRSINPKNRHSIFQEDHSDKMTTYIKQREEQESELYGTKSSQKYKTQSGYKTKSAFNRKQLENQIDPNNVRLTQDSISNLPFISDLNKMKSENDQNYDDNDIKSVNTDELYKDNNNDFFGDEIMFKTNNTNIKEQGKEHGKVKENKENKESNDLFDFDNFMNDGANENVSKNTNVSLEKGKGKGEQIDDMFDMFQDFSTSQNNQNNMQTNTNNTNNINTKEDMFDMFDNGGFCNQVVNNTTNYNSTNPNLPKKENLNDHDIKTKDPTENDLFDDMFENKTINSKSISHSDDLDEMLSSGNKNHAIHQSIQHIQSDSNTINSNRQSIQNTLINNNNNYNSTPQNNQNNRQNNNNQINSQIDENDSVYHFRKSSSSQIKDRLKEFKIPKEFQIDTSNLTYYNKLASGGYSSVVKADYRGTEVVVKLSSSTIENNSASLVSFIREIDALSQLKNQNITMMIGVFLEAYSEKFSKWIIPESDSENQFIYAIVNEYCAGGNLFSLLHESQVHINDFQKLKITMGIVKGMLYMHTNKPVIVHRDLKSLNILLTQPVENPNSYIQVKVTDFGISRPCMSRKHATFLTSATGTYHWMSPEVLKGEDYTESTDVWSFGVVLYEIIFREVPFSDMQETQLILLISNGGYKINRLDLNKKSELDKNLYFLMQDCLNYNHKMRPTFKDIKNRLDEICKNMNLKF